MGKSRRSGTGGGTEPSTDEEDKLTWESAKDDPEKLAELANMTFEKQDDGSYVFTDNETGLELRLNKGVISHHGNDGYINRIVHLVSDLPEMNKRSTPFIYILQNDFTGNYGQHGSIRNKLTKEYIGHGVAIATSTFKEGDVELKRVLYHETNHGFDYLKGKKTQISGISNTKAFKDALRADGPSSEYGDYMKYKINKYGQVTGVYSEKSLYRLGSKYLMENYAEAASIVQLKMDGNGSHKIKMPNGESVTVDKWCKDHPNLYKTVSNEIENFDVSQFGKENKGHPMIELQYKLFG